MLREGWLVGMAWQAVDGRSLEWLDSWQAWGGLSCLLEGAGPFWVLRQGHAWRWSSA